MESPLPCGNGTYANKTGLSGCETCPAGHYCGDPRLTPKPCQDGFYSNAGAVYCLECRAGYRYVKDCQVNKSHQFQTTFFVLVMHAPLKLTTAKCEN